MKKILIFLLLTTVFTSSALAGLYGIDNVKFENNLPNEHEEDDEMEIIGSAEGHSIDELRIYKESSGPDQILRDTHCGDANSCTISLDKSFSNGEKTFYVWARAKSSSGSTITDTSTRQTVDFYRKESSIESVEISPDSDTSLDVGKYQEIKGTATGKSLDRIKIKKKINGEWEVDDEESCNGEECDIAKEYRRTDKTSEEFKIKAFSGEKKKESDEIRVTWEDKEKYAELDVRVEDKDGSRLRDARVTALQFGPDYAAKSVRKNDYIESSESSRTGDRKIGFTLDDGRLNTYAKYYSGYSKSSWNNIALESVEDNELIYRYDLNTANRGQGNNKHVAEQESSISSNEKNLTIRFLVDGEEIDSFTAAIDGSEDQEFSQVRESGRTTAEGTDTTISTKSDLPYYAKKSDRNGRTSFELSEGQHRLSAWKSGYDSDHTNINLEEGDERSITLTLDKYKEDEKDDDNGNGDSEDERGDVTFERVSLGSSVCRGDETTAQIEFKNQGEEERAFRLAVEGLGSSFDRAYVLDGNEKKSVNYTFSDIQGSGNEVVAFNTGYDSRERTIQVRDCSTIDEADDISFRLKPSEVRSGQSVQVSGYVDTNRRQQVEIKLDGERRTSTYTEPDGFFRANIRSESVGERTVEVLSGDKSRTANLRVLPTVSVNSISAPDNAFEGESFELCADVESQTTPLVVLKEDGEIIESKNSRGNVCFDRRTGKGQKDYQIQAFNQGATDSKQRRVRVFESGVEARSFPDQITSVRSGYGVVKVELYNTHDELRRYELELEGLPRDWVSQSRKEVALDTGQRKSKYIYVTPKEEGVFETTLNVRSGGEVIYTENVDVRSGGTSERESLWIRLRRWWRYR